MQKHSVRIGNKRVCSYAILNKLAKIWKRKTESDNPKPKILSLKSDIWYLEYGVHVSFSRGHGCYAFGGIRRFNEWMIDVQSWMKEDKLPKYYDLVKRGDNGEKGCAQKAHRMKKSGFGTYCHHLAGHKYVLQMLLQLPILAQCSVSNPDLLEKPALTKWITDLQRQKHTQEYRDAVQRSEPVCTADHRRLSQQIWHASKVLSDGKALSRKNAKDACWGTLTDQERLLVKAYDDGRLDEELQNLVSQKPPTALYNGVAASVSNLNKRQCWRKPRPEHERQCRRKK